MPKSKKPRKPHVKKPIRAGNVLTAEEISAIQDELSDVGIAAEIKLPRGDFDEVDMLHLEITFNWIAMSLARQWLSKDDREFAAAVHKKGILSLHNVITRFTEGKTGHYVCRAEELNDIQETLALFIPALKESIKYTPRRAWGEYRAAREAVKGKS